MTRTTGNFGFLCDLDGLVDVGSTTRIEALDRRQPPTPIGEIVQFFHRSTRRSRLSKYVR
jgi:hypothetical protein